MSKQFDIELKGLYNPDWETRRATPEEWSPLWLGYMSGIIKSRIIMEKTLQERLKWLALSLRDADGNPTAESFDCQQAAVLIDELERHVSYRWLGHLNAAITGIIGFSKCEWSPNAVILSARAIADVAIKAQPEQKSS